LAASGAIDVGIFAARMIYEYHQAEKNTKEMSHVLATDLVNLSNKYYNVRVVAHSLGARLLLNALRDVPDEDKPNNIHLLAPAFAENEFTDIIGNSSKDNTFIYYSHRDVVLYTFLHLLKREEAVGAHGLTDNYNNCHQIDVTNYFKDHWLVHNNYKDEFPNFIINDKV